MPDALLIEVMQDNLTSLRQRIATRAQDWAYAHDRHEARMIESDIDALERKETTLSRKIVALKEQA